MGKSVKTGLRSYTFGIVTVTSGSTIATLGKIFLCQIADLSFSLVFVITAHCVHWLPVPAVVPIAIIGRVADVGPGVWQL